MRGSRVAAMLCGLTAAVALTACGVPPSGVVEAGEPASGMFSPTSKPATAVSLFFLRDGELTAYPRRTGDAGDLDAVVRLLFAGPTPSEAATATTELPSVKGAPRVTTGGDGTLTVRLPGVAVPLNRQAVLQLVCTAAQVAPSATTAPHADAEAAGGAPHGSSAPGGVRVRGDGWTMTRSDTCPVVLKP